MHPLLRPLLSGLSTRWVAALAIFILTFSARTAVAQTLTPYLQAATPTSIYVSWISPSGTDSTVRYGLSAGSLTSTATAPAADTKNLASGFLWHTVNLTGLTPNTYYYYKVETGSTFSQVFRFRTQPAVGAKTGHYRVLIAGDNQIQSPARWRSLIQAAKTKIEAKYGVPIEESINLLVNVGDQVDAGTPQQWKDVHFGMVNVVSSNIPVQTSIGNHEGYSDGSYTNYKSLVRYDGLKYAGITSPNSPLYYAYQVGSVVFIHMDTEQNGDTQKNWVQSIVNAANADANVQFIVSAHHRPYNVELYLGDISPWIHDTIMPILAQSPKTVLDVAGHHHLYARGQTRNYPIYHMITGGSAWDEYWGQSSQQNMDDVQKTICNWTWTILDFDMDTQTMTAETFAEGAPLVGNGNEVGIYNSKPVDICYRKIGLAAPNQPAITVANPGTISLPYTFNSTPFSTTTNETLNTTQFQVSTSSSFTTLSADVVRDFENYYLDSGSPNYTPIDQNASVNISQYTIPTNGLSNGSYYIRVRHRDKNVSWSAWSAAVPFTVTGSTQGSPSITLDKFHYPVVNGSNPVTVNYKFGPGNSTEWVGIYKKGQTPGNVGSTTWKYVNADGGNTYSNGTLTFTTTLTANTEYYACFFSETQSSIYTEIAPRVPFYVGPVPALSASKEAYTAGETVNITFSNAPGVNNLDWIGVYKIGDTPGSVSSTQWHYVTTGTSGTMAFPGLPNGYYFCNYFVNDGFTAVGNTVRFSVGSNITNLTVSKSSLAYGESFSFNYTGGPGTQKDYIGVFKPQAVPGGSAPDDKLVYYIYPTPLGAPNATVNITAAIPSGNYKAALYINDSYTAVSNEVTFTITDPRAFVVQPTQFTGNAQNGYSMTLNWPGQTGLDYYVETSTDLVTWNPVTTLTASGAAGSTMSHTVSGNPGDAKRFYRVRR